VIHQHAAEETLRELLFALESARMRFSVAIATEAKSTTRDRWQFYLETTDHMGRFIKRLRKTDVQSSGESQEWRKALETLCNLPNQSRASFLCELLGKIVNELEWSI
jgi:DnaJ-domain-containing protein 1